MLGIIDSQPVDTLVIDLRGNTGGDASVIDPLLNGLGARYLTLLAKPQFRTYVAIDKGTFSSGMDDAMEIKSTACRRRNRCRASVSTNSWL